MNEILAVAVITVLAVIAPAVPFFVVSTFAQVVSPGTPVVQQAG